MWLPTQAQVNTAGRYAGVVVGTAFTIFGLQAKGFSLDQAKAVIAALGDTVNSIVILIGVAGPLYLSVRGVNNTSPASQAAAVGATGAIVVATPEIAAATPNSPNVMSSNDVKVVQK